MRKNWNAVLKVCCHWQQLSGVEKAVEILYNAFREGTRIIVVGDFDADGATSTALSVLAMRFAWLQQYRLPWYQTVSKTVTA